MASVALTPKGVRRRITGIASTECHEEDGVAEVSYAKPDSFFAERGRSCNFFCYGQILKILFSLVPSCRCSYYDGRLQEKIMHNRISRRSWSCGKVPFPGKSLITPLSVPCPNTSFIKHCRSFLPSFVLRQRYTEPIFGSLLAAHFQEYAGVSLLFSE